MSYMVKKKNSQSCYIKEDSIKLFKKLTLVLNPNLSLPNYETLNKLLNLLGMFSYLYKENNRCISLWAKIQ